MIKKEQIANYEGVVIGWIETDTKTGNKTARDFGGVILGTYDKKSNMTRNYLGTIVAMSGDITASLITQAYEKRRARGLR